MAKIHIKRAYDDAKDQDGYRILVDRLWPRGIKKEDLHHDEWFKDMAPSSDLRKDFDHEEGKFSWFKEKYEEELNNHDEKNTWLALVKEKLDDGPVTLLYAAKDKDNNNAVVLKEWTEDHL